MRCVYALRGVRTCIWLHVSVCVCLCGWLEVPAELVAEEVAQVRKHCMCVCQEVPACMLPFSVIQGCLLHIQRVPSAICKSICLLQHTACGTQQRKQLTSH
jgi:hypothetical protein